MIALSSVTAVDTPGHQLFANASEPPRSSVRPTLHNNVIENLAHGQPAELAALECGVMTNPFAGTWVANIEQSRRHANHQFHSATLTFEISGDRISMTHAGVNASGQQESGTSILTADGQEHPIAQAPGVMVVTTMEGANVLVSEARTDGNSVGRGTYTVSEDGQTLTAKVAGTDAAGKAFEQVIVFDRG